MFRLHGNMEQEDRRTTFQTFKTEKSAILFSTDVAARGLDFPKVRCIIQYDSPGEATEYVHRYLLSGYHSILASFICSTMFLFFLINFSFVGVPPWSWDSWDGFLFSSC